MKGEPTHCGAPTGIGTATPGLRECQIRADVTQSGWPDSNQRPLDPRNYAPRVTCENSGAERWSPLPGELLPDWVAEAIRDGQGVYDRKAKVCEVTAKAASKPRNHI
jgi:hypothetical protein